MVAGVGILGVALLVLRSPGHLDALGLVGAFGSVVPSAFGFVLIKRWTPPVDLLTLVWWQLVAGGLAGQPGTLAWVRRLGAARGHRSRTAPVDAPC